MRNIASSLFILMLLLLALLVVSTWFIGEKNKEFIQDYFDDETKNSNHLFDSKLNKFTSAIFTSKANISIHKNSENELVDLITHSFDEENYEVRITNGPFLLNQPNVNFGRSFWEFTKDPGIDTDKESKAIEHLLHQARIRVDFNNNVHYEVPIELGISTLLLKGVFNVSNNKHTGTISSNGFLYRQNKHQIKSEAFVLHYYSIVKPLLNDQSNIEIGFKANNIEVEYKHDSMNEKLHVSLNYNGSTIFKNDTLKSSNTISYAKTKNSYYPFDVGTLSFDIDNVNLNYLADLLSELSNLQNKSQQTQWVLEEQGELPEGQDQIWQLQDEMDLSLKTIPNLTKTAFTNSGNNSSVFQFKLNAQYKGKQSHAQGNVQPSNAFATIEDISELSISSFALINTSVKLDKLLFDFLAQHLPLKNQQFELIYKNNKLLMQ